MLAQYARVSVRSVRRALATLIALSEIVPIGKAEHGVVMYRITPGGKPVAGSQETISRMIKRLQRVGRQA
jgi:hypothetical protein